MNHRTPFGLVRSSGTCLSSAGHTKVTWSLVPEGLFWARMPKADACADDDLGSEDELGWHSFTLAADQGSDGYSAMNFIQRSCGVVVQPMWCASHGSWRDFQKCVRDAGLWSFFLCLMICMNIVHGPWSEDQRHRQVTEAWCELRKRLTPSQCPLYQEWAGNILWERGMSQGALNPNTQDLWASLGQTTPWQLKDYKVNLNRFWHAVQKAREYATHWSTFLLGWTWLALESDLLASAAVKRLLFPTAPSADEQGRPSTDADRVGVDDRALRASCTNAVVITVLFMSSRLRLFIVRMLLTVSAPVEAWYRFQAHHCREAFANASWFQSQVRGAFMRQLYEVLQVLSTPKDILWMGFDEPQEVTCLKGDHLEAAVLQNDEMAERLGLITLCMIAARAQRALWFLRGWPQRLVGMLDSVRMTTFLCHELREDYEVYKKFKAAAQSGEAHVATWLRRSVMRLPSVIMMVRALRRREWQPDASFYAWLERHTRRFTNSVLCEDGFNVSKNSRRVKGKKRYMRPQKALTTVLQKRVTSKLHRYVPVLQRSAPAFRGASVPAAAWAPCVNKQRAKWKGLVSAKQSTSWYSPGPDRDAVQHADLAVGRAICATDPPRFDLLSSVWIGEVCDKKHKFVMRRPGSDEWFMPLTAIPGSAVLAWPGRIRRLASGMNDEVFVFEPEPESVSLELVASFADWTARSFLWRSPAYFASSMQGGHGVGAPLAVRPVMSSIEMPLLRLCAKHGFWSMAKSWLQKLSAHIGVPWRSGAIDCEAVFELAKHCLDDDSGDSALDGLRYRLSAMDAEIADDDDALSALDEAVEVLEKRDEKQVTQAKEQAATKSADVAVFREGLKVKAAQVRAAVAKAKPAARRKTSSSASTRKHKYPIGRVAHSEAKRYCPPGAFVWRGLNDGAWWGRVPPFKRVSRSWAAYGEEQALKLVLESLWATHLETQGLGLDACPWAGLFETT